MAPILALTGYMGSGKSVVGRLIADRLSRSFVDLDSEFEARSGVSIAECFAEQGELGFRQTEGELLRTVLGEHAHGDLVLALGGGTLTSPANLQAVRGTGVVLLLDADVEEAWDRAKDSGRPLAREKESFVRLFAARRVAYEESADWIMPTAGLTATQVAQGVCSLVQAGMIDSGSALWGRALGGTARGSLIVGGESALEVLRRQASSAREQGKAMRLITDAHVMTAWGEKVSSALGVAAEDMLVLDPGEQSKSAECLSACWDWLCERNSRRTDIVVALGGGVVGDLAGLAAATYHRGIGLWQVPTSLLAQIDSSVGGKTAINLSAAKNQVGAFYQADLVVIDPATLSTLPQIEFIGALGEVVKHALLSGEAALSALEEDCSDILARDGRVLSALVKRNVWFKASVVQEDERELGRRAILNLGHTAAHALESALGYGSVSHGQAVALGLLVALRVSELGLGLDPHLRTRVERLLSRLGLETKVDLPPLEAIAAATSRDKKATAGVSGFVGLEALGVPIWGMEVAPATLTECVEVIRR